MKTTGWAAAEALAAQQAGAITREQLLTLDLKEDAIRWALRRRRIFPLTRGSFRLSAFQPTALQLTFAVVRAHPQQLFLSHDSAAAVWSLEGFGRLQFPLHVTVPNGCRYGLGADVVVHQTRHQPLVVSRQGLPVTGLARTVVDVAPSLSTPELERLLDATHVRWRSFHQWLGLELATLDGTRREGLPALTSLFSERTDSRAESVLEARVRSALQRTRVIACTEQFDVFDHRGHVSRIDFAWPRHKVALHCDGYRFHAGRMPFERDADQRTRLAALGWKSVTVTWASLDTDHWRSALLTTLDRTAPPLSSS